MKEPSEAVPCCKPHPLEELYIHVASVKLYMHRGLISCATALAVSGLT